MRKDLSLIRRLEKIEKEMGYCQIKIEKEQRLAIQLEFLRCRIDQVTGALSDLRPDDTAVGNKLSGYTFRECQQLISTGKNKREVRKVRRAFIAVGMIPYLEDEMAQIEEGIEETGSRLGTFTDFHSKQDGLERERRSAMSNFDLTGEEEVLRISQEFEETERHWNVLTEDLTNLDEALFHIGRTIDYLNSARNFVLTSRSHFSIPDWLTRGYIVDLLKHSTIGRVREMLEGSERNLKDALGELSCLEGIELGEDEFAPLIPDFYDGLFHDLFSTGQFDQLLLEVEQRLDGTEKLSRRMQKTRDTVFDQQVSRERARESLFHRIGDERRKLRLVFPATEPGGIL